MEEKIKLFQKVIDLAKEYNVDLKVEKNYFYTYMCLLDSIKFSGKEIKFTDKELARLTDRAVDIFLDTDEDSICSIDEITDYLVENYKDLDDLTNIDIIEDILC